VLLARYRYEVHYAFCQTLVDGDGVFSFSFLLPACNLNVQQTHAQTALYAAAVVEVAKVLVTAACNSDAQHTHTLAQIPFDVAA
jgi:hypothetical protein